MAIPRKHPDQPIEFMINNSGHWKKMGCAEEIWNCLDDLPFVEIRLRVPPKVWMKYKSKEAN